MSMDYIDSKLTTFEILLAHLQEIKSLEGAIEDLEHMVKTKTVTTRQRLELDIAYAKHSYLNSEYHSLLDRYVRPKTESLEAV